MAEKIVDPQKSKADQPTPPVAVQPKVKPGLQGVEANLPSVAPFDPERDRLIEESNLEKAKSTHADKGLPPVGPGEVRSMHGGLSNISRINDPTGGAIVEHPITGKPRYVRALAQSYVHGVVLEPGQVSIWPYGVEELGANLEEYFFE